MSRRTHYLFLAPILATLTTGCMTGPQNGDSVCGAEAQVRTSGFAFGEPGERIVIAAAPTPTGPWTDIASAMASTSAITWVDKDNSTELYYAWDAGNLTVPPANWTVEGNVRAAYVKGYIPKASSSGTDIGLVSFDIPALAASHEDWFTCADNLWKAAANMKFYNAVLQCASPQRPVVRITAPIDSTCPCTTTTTFVGDVVVNDPTNLPALRCVSEITGTLTVKNGPALDRVSLPQLLKIDQDLTVDLTPSSTTAAPRTISLPALASIGNAVAFTANTASGATTNVDLGLPAMAAIGGDVSLTFTGPQKLTGLAPLATLNKNLTIDFGSDTDASGLFSSLSEVKGNTSVTVRGNLTGLLPALAKVDGTLSVAHTSAATQSATFGLAKVATVVGGLNLQGTPWPSFGGGAFGKLATVGGDVRLEQTQLTTFDLGLATLAVGGLQIGDNLVLRSFPLRSVTVAPAGDITVLNDPTLPTCQLGAFVDAQTAAGWNGPLSVSGTDDNATCP